MHRRRIHSTTSAAAVPAGFKKRQLAPKPVVVPKKKGMLVVLERSVTDAVEKETKNVSCKSSQPNANKTSNSFSVWTMPAIETEPLKPRKRTVSEPIKIPSSNLACDKPRRVYCAKQPSWQAGGVVDFAKSHSIQERYDVPLLSGSMDCMIH
jgi:hypothetical protein